jgi:hypothetical protein
VEFAEVLGGRLVEVGFRDCPICVVYILIQIVRAVSWCSDWHRQCVVYKVMVEATWLGGNIEINVRAFRWHIAACDSDSVLAGQAGTPQELLGTAHTADDQFLS